MEDFENRNESGQINGFDSAENETNGYTVTPDGGFYTKQKEDIIQDEAPNEPAPEPKPQPEYQQPVNSYQPNYSYTANPYYRANTYTPVKKEKKRYGAGVVIVACILAAVIGAVSCFSLTFSLGKIFGDNSSSVATAPQSNVNITVDETSTSVVEAVAKKVTPSVVGIRTTTSVMSFFGQTQSDSGEGSGVIYSSDGYIITNYHVIAEAVSNKSSSKIEVFIDTADKESYTATIVGYNISADLAVIKINAKNLTAVEFANSDELNVGQYVITVGNPGGLEFMDSVTYGVISGLNRTVSSNSDIPLIQTDAAINPGNSGGALVNVKGQLVGINSSKIVSEEFEGMGFAIPSNTTKEICEDIISRENSPEPYVGISISERYTSQVLKFYGYPAGAVVLSVAESSPAANAGIQRGDIITEYNGKEITDYTLLEQYIMDSKPGDNVTVKIYRGGRYYSTTLTVGSNNTVN